MKKVLYILLAIVMIGLTGCGSNENDIKEAFITTNEGNKVELSSKYLMDIFDSNEAKFYKLYGGAMITFESTVKSISVDTYVMVEDGHTATEQNKIVFEDGWCLVIGSENENFDLADYDAGDVLRVTTSIVAPGYTDPFKELSDERVVWLVGNDKIHYDTYSDIKTTITKVN